MAAICPLKGHQVCNVRNEDESTHEDNKHQCTCAVTVASDRPAPEQSCTNLIKRDEDGSFPVVSLTFNLKDSPDMDEFPEESFRDTISSALRVNPADILLLRVNCQGTEDTLTVQFGVLKKKVEEEKKPMNVKKITKKDDDDDEDDDDDDEEEDDKEDKDKDDDGKDDKDDDGDDDEDDDDDDDDKKNDGKRKQKKDDDDDDDDDSGDDDDEDDEDEDDDDDEPIKYDPDMFVDAESVATRMKAMGHLSQIADLQVDTIEFTEDLIALEYEPDNTTLAIQAVAAGISVVLMLLLGIWATCRKNGYSDDLQKA